jgi:hypothetical protein
MHARHLFVVALAIVASTVGLSAPRAGALTPIVRPSIDDQYTMLAVMNQYRAEPHVVPAIGSQPAYTAKPVFPMMWNEGAHEVAQAYTESCMSGAGCGYALYDQLARQYYPPASFVFDANASGWWPTEPPQAVVMGYMSSPPHERAILSSQHVSVGPGDASNGEQGFDVETFDWIEPTGGIPPIQAGGVTPRLGDSHGREILANYFDPSGATPKSVVAVYGATTIPLPLMTGRAGFGTYGITSWSPPTSGCVPFHIEATPASGPTYRWPTNRNLLVGAGTNGASCADSVPASPLPPTLSAPKNVKVALGPSKMSVTATLPWFNPSDVNAIVTVANNGSSISRGGYATCVYPCPRYKGYGFTVTRNRDGTWKFMYKGVTQGHGPYASGPVTVSFTDGGITQSITLAGTLNSGTITASG